MNEKEKNLSSAVYWFWTRQKKRWIQKAKISTVWLFVGVQSIWFLRSGNMILSILSEHSQCNNNYFFHIVYFWSSLYVAVAVFSVGKNLFRTDFFLFLYIYLSLYFCSKNVYCLFVNEIEYFLGILIAIPIQVLASYAQPYTIVSTHECCL